MQTVEQIYGDKAPKIREGVKESHLRVTTAKVTIAAEKARTEANVELPYERVDILDEAGGLIIYGSLAKLFEDATYASDLGVRAKLRAQYLASVQDPDKEARKMAELGVKMGLYKDVETGLASIKEALAAKNATVA